MKDPRTLYPENNSQETNERPRCIKQGEVRPEWAEEITPLNYKLSSESNQSVLVFLSVGSETQTYDCNPYLTNVHCCWSMRIRYLFTNYSFMGSLNGTSDVSNGCYLQLALLLWSKCKELVEEECDEWAGWWASFENNGCAIIHSCIYWQKHDFVCQCGNEQIKGTKAMKALYLDH